MRHYARHTLAEGEEKIMALKSNTSGQAFARLFDETVNSIPFYLEKDGKREKKTEAEVLSLLHSADREDRKKSSRSLADGLKENSRLLTYIYNMILADHRTSLRIRNFHHPIDPMNLSNEIKLEDVLRLIQSVKDSYPLAQKYYDLKKRLLGLEKLYDYDRYAPIGHDDAHLDFGECKRIVLEGYYAFSKEAGEIVEKFFEKRWIDAEVREGKYSGGFCCATTPDLHPYILVNYTGSIRDVMVVAHELGHGIHQYLAAKRVGILECDAPLTLAETASVFGEMLIFEKILEKEKDPAKQLGLLCGKIDDNLSTVHRQIVLTEFERASHEAGLKKGELSAEELSDIWMKVNSDLYGESVELTENYRYGWKYIPHFIHSPFYCYAYAFAQLFVLTLFQKYKEDKTAFIPRYFEMLSLGGSKTPEEIASIAGLDINKPDFWRSGIAILGELIEKAETTSIDAR
jgi:oligoendopeptidase F